MHPVHGAGEWDAVYAAQNSPERYARGADVFRRRNPGVVTAERSEVQCFTVVSPQFSDWIEWQAEFCDIPRTLMRVDEEMGKAKFGEAHFNAICAMKASAILGMMTRSNAPDYVLHLDADVLLFSPLSQLVGKLKEAMREKEAWIAGAHDPDTGLCCGVFLVRNCQESVAFMRRWAQLCEQHPEANDQILCNHLLSVGGIPFGLVTSGVVSSYGNTLWEGVWNGDVSKIPYMEALPLAWHCNYVIGEPMKRRMAEEIKRRAAPLLEARRSGPFSQNARGSNKD
jgi:hypothetical protein